MDTGGIGVAASTTILTELDLMPSELVIVKE
jgi:hypothetical protein